MSNRPTLLALTVFGLFTLACGPLTQTTEDEVGGVSDTGKSAHASKAGADDGGSSGSPIKAGQVVPAKTGGIANLMLPGHSSDVPPPKPALTAKQCNDIVDGGPVKGPDCITDVIECGQTIYGHTSGGTNNFNTRWYEKNFCTPATTNHDGGDERVYLFRFPDDGKWRAWFTLDTPCADLDVAAIQWNKTTCPTLGSDVPECDMSRKDGTTRERAEAISDGRWQQWLVVVEGVNNEEGPFALTAQCREGLQ